MVIVIRHPHAGRCADMVRAEHPDLEVVACTTPAELELELPRAEVLLLSGSPFPRLETARRLRWVQVLSAGVDRPLLTLPPGVVLSRGYGLHRAPMAEHCLGYILAHALNLRRALENQAARRWERYPVTRLAGTTLGIAGLGTIGEAIARRARALDMTVVGLRRTARRARYVEQVYPPSELHAFLGRSDYVVALLPLTPATQGMFGAAEFEAMKPGAVFMNLGRGGLVREDELVAGLRRGRPAYALLDVFATEPLPPESELWGLPNVVITPHRAGGSTSDTHPDEGLTLFLENLGRYRRGQRLRGLVDRARGY